MESNSTKEAAEIVPRNPNGCTEILHHKSWSMLEPKLLKLVRGQACAIQLDDPLSEYDVHILARYLDQVRLVTKH